MNNKEKDNLEIIISLNGDEISAVKKFINCLEFQYKDFNEKMEIERNELSFIFKKESLKNVISYLPDCFRFESPVTLLSGDWGVGKTYFINLLCKYINNNIDSWSNIFKNIVVIDCLDLINSKDIIRDMSKKLYYEVIEPSNRFMFRFIDYLKKKVIDCLGFKHFYNNVIKPSSRKFCFQNYELETIIKSRKMDEDIYNDKKATIVFIDNVERLEEKSYEIITSIYELAKIQKMYIVFVAEKEIFYSLIKNKDNKDDNKENIKNKAIEKFITTRKFELMLDTKTMLEKDFSRSEKFNFFKNFFFSNNEIDEIFNDVFWSNRIIKKNINYNNWQKIFDVDNFGVLNREQDNILSKSLICFYFFKKLLNNKKTNYFSIFKSILNNRKDEFILKDELICKKYEFTFNKISSLLSIDLNLLRKIDLNNSIRELISVIESMNNMLKNSKDIIESYLITNLFNTLRNYKISILNRYKHVFEQKFYSWDKLKPELEMNKTNFNDFDNNLSNMFVNWYCFELENCFIDLFKIMMIFDNHIFNSIKQYDDGNFYKKHFNDYFSFFDDEKIKELENEFKNYFDTYDE